MFNFWILICLWIILTIGIRMIFERHLLRRLLGFSLISYIVNLCLLFSGSTGVHDSNLGTASFIREGISFEAMIDPLPQALILTAIVIGFALTGFLVVYEICIKKESAE